MSRHVSGWSAAFRKQNAKHVHEKMNNDLNKLLTAEDVQKFKDSDVGKNAVKILGSATDETTNLGRVEYVTVWDYLTASICLANANRSGVLSTMTVSQFEQARLVDGQYVMSVEDHKTAASYGPAKVVLTPLLHSWLAVFVRHIRPRVAGNRKELFVSWTGESLTSGQISRGVQSVWRSAGCGEGITANVIRKTAVSSVHKQRPEMNAALADLMCHRVSTAEKSYRIIERERASVAASKMLSGVLNPQAVEPEVSVTGTVEQVNSEISMNGTVEEENSDDDIIGPSSHDTLRDVFQLEDVKALSEIGSNIIKQGAISRDRVSLAFNVSLSYRTELSLIYYLYIL